MKIVVLAGGISTERDVSLSTGRMIYNALKKNGHKVILLDSFLGYEGEDVDIVFDLDKEWATQSAGIAEINPDVEQVKALRPDWKKNFFGPNVIKLCQDADVVFMALHGGDGENGRIQAYFDLMGIKYTGTDYVSSALSMDKAITKDMFRAGGIPTPVGFHLKKGEAVTEVKFPCVVKASCGGSSVGVSIAHDQEQFKVALEEGFKYDEEVVVEQYIKGREFSVGVMAGKALPIIEIAPKEGFYDYKNKYQAGSTVETCPAVLSKEKTEEMQEIAEKVFKILRLKNYARMDFLMEEGTANLYCLEANTLPGMTPTSLLPQEAQAIGMSFEQLCEEIIRISLEERG